MGYLTRMQLDRYIGGLYSDSTKGLMGYTWYIEDTIMTVNLPLGLGSE